MTREQIEKAGRDYALDQLGIVGLPGRAEAMKAFISGAQWRINSVWHNSDEEPEERKEILVEYRFMTPAGEIEVRKEVVESLDDLSDIYCNVLNWAYLDDLLPERKEKME